MTAPITTPLQATTWETSPYMTARICYTISHKPALRQVMTILSLPLSLPVSLLIDTVVFVVANIFGGIIGILIKRGLVEDAIDQVVENPALMEKLAKKINLVIDKVALNSLMSKTALIVAISLALTLTGKLAVDCLEANICLQP